MTPSLLLVISLTAVCDLREIDFGNGYRVKLPPKVCVTKSVGNDSTIFQFTTNPEARPFLEAYAGSAANFVYFVPDDGKVSSEKCGDLRVAETRLRTVTQIGGATGRVGGRCGEVLVRKREKDGAVRGAAVHFWYSRLTPLEEALARTIIDATEAK
jgi:hypothetical protein